VGRTPHTGFLFKKINEKLPLDRLMTSACPGKQEPPHGCLGKQGRKQRKQGANAQLLEGWEICLPWHSPVWGKGKILLEINFTMKCIMPPAILPSREKILCSNQVKVGN
jgi:hypothetical protein